jgi:hypothetical protein
MSERRESGSYPYSVSVPFGKEHVLAAMRGVNGEVEDDARHPGDRVELAVRHGRSARQEARVLTAIVRVASSYNSLP